MKTTTVLTLLALAFFSASAACGATIALVIIYLTQ